MGRAIWILVAALAGCARVAESPTVAVTVVDERGEATLAEWGDWHAEPGAVDVTPRTFLRVEGTGAWLVRFLGEAAFGVSNRSWSIPLAGNVDLGVAYAPEAPDFASLEWSERVTEARVVLSPDRPVAFVATRLHRVPIPLEAQDYHTPFEVVAAP